MPDMSAVSLILLHCIVLLLTSTILQSASNSNVLSMSGNVSFSASCLKTKCEPLNTSKRKSFLTFHMTPTAMVASNTWQSRLQRLPHVSMHHSLKIMSTVFDPYGINKLMQILYQKLLQIKESLLLMPHRLIYPQIWQLLPPMDIVLLGHQVLKACRPAGAPLLAVMMRTLLYISKACLWPEIVLLEPLQPRALSQHLLY